MAAVLDIDRSRTARSRRHLGWRKEILLASLPTVVVLAVFAFIERFTHQRLLFASLGASAFLIYLDPEDATNSPRTLLIAQLGGAVAGFAFVSLFSSSRSNAVRFGCSANTHHDYKLACC